jgi:hypothetical protein
MTFIALLFDLKPSILQGRKAVGPPELGQWNPLSTVTEE